MTIYNGIKVRSHGMAVNYHSKIFYNIGQGCLKNPLKYRYEIWPTGAIVIKLFTAVIYELAELR